PIGDPRGRRFEYETRVTNGRVRRGSYDGVGTGPEQQGAKTHTERPDPKHRRPNVSPAGRRRHMRISTPSPSGKRTLAFRGIEHATDEQDVTRGFVDDEEQER